MEVIADSIKMIFVFATLYYFVADEKSFNKNNMSLFDHIYYSTMVQTTVGLGDIHPTDVKIKFLTIVQSLGVLSLLIKRIKYIIL
jgi:hypothetical protein